MKSKKNLESLKDGLFCLKINANLVSGGGEDKCTLVYTTKGDAIDCSDDTLKPPPIFKAN